MARVALHDEIALVSATCRRLGLGEVSPALLNAANHTTLLLPQLALVARVQSDGPIDSAGQRARRELAVARHLAERGAPALAPLGEVAGPHIEAPAVISLWPYMRDARTADEDDAGVAVASLGALHRALHDLEGLPAYTDALARCWAVLTEGNLVAALDRADRQILAAQYQRLRRKIEAAGAPWIALHGDVHLGNLLLNATGPLWLDFEDVCCGPREYDIAGLPPETWPSFDGADLGLIETCADLRSVCVAVWCASDITRSDEVREAAAYHLQRVRELPA